MDARLPPDEGAPLPAELDGRLQTIVVEAERALLSPEVRGDRAALERLLDRQFIEIGQSGRLWTRAEMIAALVAEGAASAAAAAAGEETAGAAALVGDGDGAAPPTDASPGSLDREMSEIRTTMLGPETILLTYLLYFDGRWSRRSSIWVVPAGSTARIVFHQGTPRPSAQTAEISTP
ncbi:nuclear transport factor 2 family protein [Subtercola endophyticus]|uniref:nuclear transport factor 2 family protein n=1 Tax=Subtercola endophyticus TaxID=2895559 RepID=UPI001E53ACAF|nr:DUF4440 domain-containing protein [Subtercola endophyticus]UFS59278.1 DUF4440 domain-containing protein [Subtercola endophyticus]